MIPKTIHYCWFVGNTFILIELLNVYYFEKSIYNSISKITFDQNLNMIKGSGSLRGITVSEVNYARDTISIEYGIFIDIEKEYNW